ncbi:MAG: hypothetical protein GAK43_01307 [Stenotrophomonas maltophilia]|nr:MAG: hypothetical protein GAK43_01307 [Stenotrophomonas maltophilia]
MSIDVELLQKLEANLASTLLASSFLAKPSFSTRIIDCVRKLRIARELNQLYYIAVAGSQSAGKTRLIRELYALDEHWLKDNDGRGERLPVFIIETDDPRAPFATRIAVSAGRVAESEITPEEFRRLVSGWDAGSATLFPKLYVPRRHFHGQQVGFVLLPGYELENQDNATWQRVMRHTLKHSLGSLLVTDQARLADNGQKDILRDLSSAYFKGRLPVAVVSKTESVPADKLDGLRERASEVFEIPQDHVICTGTGDAALVADWTTQLIGALDRYALPAASTLETRLEELEQLVDGDLCDIQALIDDALQGAEVRRSAPEKQRDDVLAWFDQASTKYRRKYARQVNRHTGEYAERARKVARQRYIDEEEGFSNTVFGGIANFLTKTSGEREDTHVRRISECWRGRDLDSTPAQSQYLALSDMSRERLQLDTPENSQQVGERLAQGTVELLGYHQDGIGGDLKLDSEPVRKHMANLFNPMPEQARTELTVLEQAQFQEMITLVPAVAMEYLRINQGLMLKHAAQLPQAPTTQSMGQFIGDISKDLPAFHDSAKSLLRTIGCILAVDVAVDGQLDTIPALLQSIFGAGSGAATASTATTAAAATAQTGTATTTTAGGAAAGSLGASLAGALVVAFVAYRATVAVQRHDAACRGYISTVIGQLADAQINHQMDLYDEAMERVRERLHRGLGIAYGLDTALSDKDNLLRAAADLERARLNALRNIRAAQLLV